ncbi:MAG: alpha/beta hydrolase [Salinisphaera sp.]|jgi:phospholipase/carboxylesterase|nr:alpha/beta hydrolase [Salinisphaera sp.]
MAEFTYPTYRYAGEANAPLVIAFHGTGGDETQFVELIRQMLPRAGILAPRGDVSEGGANRYFRRTGEGVYDMADLALRTERMAAFVAQARTDYPNRPFYGLGYSNGANILASVLFEEPQLFERAALLHPLIPWTPAPQPGLAGKRLFVSAGTQDPICPILLTHALIDWLVAQGTDVDTAIGPGGHQVSREELQALQHFMTHETAVSQPDSRPTNNRIGG